MGKSCTAESLRCRSINLAKKAMTPEPKIRIFYRNQGYESIAQLSLSERMSMGLVGLENKLDWGLGANSW